MFDDEPIAARGRAPGRARRMRRTALRVAWLAAAWCGMAATAGAQERLDRRLPADRDLSLRIFNLTGAVRVIGWDRDSVAVTGTLGKGLRFAMGGTRSAMKLGPDRQDEQHPGPPTILEVRVPRTARVWIKTSSAPVTVDGVRGGLDVYTVDGAIEVAGDPRELRAESMDGDITVTGAPAWVRLKTAAGAVDLRGGGGDVGLSSVSGGLTVSGGPVERGRLETVSGPIVFAAAMVRGGSYDFDSHGGRVELRIPPDLGVDLEATTLHGMIDGPVTAGRARPAGRTFSLVSGDAAARIAVRTFKGSIHLRRP